jgi:Xaa-Pro aminopeptidase
MYQQMRKITYIIIAIVIFNSSFAEDNKYIYPYLNDIPPEQYKARRTNVISSMSEKSALLILSPEFYCLSSQIYGIKQNRDLFYLTGVPEQKAALLLIPYKILYNNKYYSEFLFLDEQTKNEVLWNGYSLSPIYAEQNLKIDKALNFTEFDNIFKKSLLLIDTLYILDFKLSKKTESYSRESTNISDSRILEILNNLNNLIIIKNPKFTDYLREIKSNEELALLRKAIDISISGFYETIRNSKPGMNEFELQSIMEYNFKKNGAESSAYASIIGSGYNSCFIHYIQNNRIIQNNEMVLMDCGASYHGYCADITRTFPIDGKFSQEQKILYNVVLEAQDSAISQCQTGNNFMKPNLMAIEIIQKRLIELEIIKEPQEYRYYLPHGVSHYIGLDVHDAGSFGKLKKGDVITVEPGIYIPEGSLCDKKWWNIGIRIEDDILITDNEPEILSIKLPRKVEDIERMMTNK